MMNLFALSSLLAFVSSTVMAVFLFSQKKSATRYLWALFSLSVAVWGLGGYKIVTTNDPIAAEFWWRITHIGIIFIPVLFTHFVYKLLDLHIKIPFIIALYTAAVFFLSVNFIGDLFIADVRFVFDQFYYDSPPGFFYTPFVIFFFALIIFSHIKLWDAFKISHGTQRDQLKLLFSGMLFSFAGGGASFLPVYGIDFYPYFNLTVFLYPIIVGYAIIQYKFLNAKTFLVQILAILIAFISLLELLTVTSPQQYFIRVPSFAIISIAAYFIVKSVKKEIFLRSALEVKNTNLRKFNNRLRRTNQELRRTNNEISRISDEKTNFVSTASHQLRTPITSIKAYVSMIGDGTFGEVQKPVFETTQKVQRVIEHALRLINDLLNLSRIEGGKVDFTPQRKQTIENIVARITEEFGPVAEGKDLSLEVDLPETALPLIEMDDTKVYEVFSNLVSNALKYTERGHVIIHVRQHDDSIRVTISDTGMGIKPETIKKLFEKFERGDAAAAGISGTGIGLYVIKGFIELHGGRIWAESDGPDKGSRFIFELPLEISEATFRKIAFKNRFYTRNEEWQKKTPGEYLLEDDKFTKELDEFDK